jgi:MFS family permease
MEEIIGYIEVFAGVGQLMGPLAGGFFNDIGGYLLPFYINIGIFLLLLPIIYFFVPKNVSGPKPKKITDA